jgi:hypothetical protein
VVVTFLRAIILIRVRYFFNYLHHQIILLTLLIGAGRFKRSRELFPLFDWCACKDVGLQKYRHRWVWRLCWFGHWISTQYFQFNGFLVGGDCQQVIRLCGFSIRGFLLSRLQRILHLKIITIEYWLSLYGLVGWGYFKVIGLYDLLAKISFVLIAIFFTYIFNKLYFFMSFCYGFL